MDRRTLSWSMQIGDLGFSGTIAKRGSLGGGRPKSAFNPSVRLKGLKWAWSEKKKATCDFVFYNEDLAYFESPLFAKGEDLDYSFGYLSEQTEVFSGQVTGVKGFREITVETVCVEGRLDYVEKQRSWQNPSDGKPLSIYEIVQELATFGGFANMIIDDKNPRILKPPPAALIQDGKTDREFLLDLAEDLNWVFFTRLENGVPTLHFHPRWKQARPYWELTWRGGEGNLIDFNIVENNVLGLVGNIEGAGFDPDTGDLLHPPGQKPKTSLAPMTDVVAFNARTAVALAAQLKQEPKAGKRGKGILTDPIANLMSGKTDAEAEKQQEEQIKATATLVGEPRFPFCDTIDLSGVPTSLAGTWFVTGAEHRLDEKGFITELTLMRDSTGMMPAGSEGWNAAAGDPNEKKAKDRKTLMPVIATNAKTGETFKQYTRG